MHNQIHINYSFSSYLGNNDAERYNNTILGSIIYTDANEKDITIGTFRLYKLLLDKAINNGFSIYDVCDIHQSTLDIAEIIFDFSKADFKKSISICEVMSNDIVILDRIEILPEYRGKDIAKYVIKDIYNNFANSTLFVLKCFPLQYEGNISENFATDYKKLSDYYKNIGFFNIKGVDKSIMFISSNIVNKKIDKIEF